MRRISLSLLFALSLLAIPFGAAAEGGIRVSDTVAGLGTSVELNDVIPSQTLDLHLISESGEDTVISAKSDARGNAVVTIPERLTTEAGTYRVFAVSGLKKLTPDATFEVLHDRVDEKTSRISVSDALLSADGRASSIVTVTLLDSLGNPLPGRPVALVGSRTEDRIIALTGVHDTDDNGQILFSVQTQTPGNIAIRAMDLLSGMMLNQVAHITAGDSEPSVGGSFLAQVSGSDGSSVRHYDILKSFSVTVSTPDVKAGDVIPLVSVTAVDQNGNTVENFTGPVSISSSDPGAALPIDRTLTFTGNRRGTYDINWLISFKKAGPQTIVVTDSSGTVRGQAVVNVSGGALHGAAGITLETPKDGDTVNTQEILIKGKDRKLALRNLHVFVADAASSPDALTTGTPAAVSDADGDGAFSFTVKLPPKSTDVILEMQDGEGQYDTGILHLTVDTKGPTVKYTFSPEHPQEGDSVTLSVKSDPGLPDVTLKILEQELTLTEGDPGTYTVLFQAPRQGAIDVVISARDPAGNVTDAKGTLPISGPTLPQVQNVRAESLAGGIRLTWDPIPDSGITGYRIETGLAPLHADKTDNADTSGSFDVKPLKAGIDYFLTVRAVRDQDIGPPSAPVSARTLGMELTVTPQEDSLLLQWTFPDTTPLASFLLEYGSPDGDFSEQRTLDGGMRVFTLRDLFPQTYQIRLTPVATTGQILTELAVTGEGTPVSTGFHPAAGELIHSNNPPDNGLHAGAPETPASGLPALPVRPILALTALILGIYWYRRRRAIQQTREFLNVMQRQYHS